MRKLIAINSHSDAYYYWKGDYVMLLLFVLTGTVIALLLHVPIELIAIVVALIAAIASQ